jgi:hypothetical protein
MSDADKAHVLDACRLGGGSLVDACDVASAVCRQAQGGSTLAEMRRFRESERSVEQGKPEIDAEPSVHGLRADLVEGERC